MSDPVTLYGTAHRPPAAQQITLGDLSFTLQDGALRHIRKGGTEMLRAISFLVRDRDWGTLVPEFKEISRHHDGDFRLSARAVYTSGGATLAIDLEIMADDQGLRVSASGAPDQPFETNRTGFTILHPAHLAGSPVVVGHGDEADESAIFPVEIDPWQPFMNITSLTHDHGGLRVRCAMQGDTFEMEDQRQWGDASYKTYNRPLALPWPFHLEAGAVFSQSVHLTWQPVETAPATQTADLPEGVTFPETAIVLTAEDARRLAKTPTDIAKVAPQRLLCHIDGALGDTQAQFAAFGALQQAVPDLTYDAELICAFDDPPEAELARLRRECDGAGFRPDSVLVCPSVDRQSTPPGSDWPACPPLEDIHTAAARAFSDVTRGGGMVSFFPELNRKRPPLEQLAFVSHGLCPIIHAADDLSVMETLQTIPHITRSARAIIKDRDYRIGPATIAMRQNPYGTRTIPNPDGQRLCMSDDDPRHRALFGAAYVIGLATALAGAGITVWTPAALYGPRGLEGPITQAIAALARCAGQPVHEARIHNGLATLVVGGNRFQANLTATPLGGFGPYEWRRSVA